MRSTFWMTAEETEEELNRRDAVRRKISAGPQTIQLEDEQFDRVSFTIRRAGSTRDLRARRRSKMLARLAK